MFKEPKHLNIQHNGNLTIIDSTSWNKSLKFYRRDAPISYYPIFYMGRKKDTLSLGQNPISPWKSAEGSNYGHLKNWELSFEDELKITVDTTFKLAFQGAFTHYDQQSLQVIFDSFPSYHAYPVMISNESDSLIQVGSSNLLFPMILQIQSTNGVWINAENFPMNACGTGLRDIVLEADQVAVAKFIRHAGQRKILCRLRFTRFGNVVYSNTFYDWVDDAILKKVERKY